MYCNSYREPLPSSMVANELVIRFVQQMLHVTRKDTSAQHKLFLPFTQNDMVD